MGIYEVLTLIINALIAIGTIATAIIAVRLANRKDLLLKTENCKVRACFVALDERRGYTENFDAGNPQNTAMQISIFNEGIRPFYVQSISMICCGKVYVFPKNIVKLSDIKIDSGYREIIHISFAWMTVDKEFLAFYRDNCMEKEKQFCVETVFLNKFYCNIDSQDMFFVESIIKISLRTARVQT